MSETDQKNPPRGDFQKAEEYINKLVDLLNRNKLQVIHTDLKKFDPTTLQDHYTVNLNTYHIEISHSKQPNTGKDSYVMIFNNLKNLAEGQGEKVILAYIYLADSQFSKFKIVADRQIEEKRRAEEERKFNEALQPIDELLDKAAGEAPSHAPNLISNPIMQSFKNDFKSELNTSLDNPERSSDNLVSAPQIHQI